MWLFTTVGFYSVVSAEEFGQELQVRARAAHDLDQLRQHFIPSLGPNVSKPGRDYPWRAFVSREDFAAGLAELGKAIDYSNFKSAVAHQQGHGRAHVYQEVWSACRKIESSTSLRGSTSTPRAKLAQKDSVSASFSGDYSARDLHVEGEWPRHRKRRYGGIVFNNAAEILLREPKNHFDGYHWTFPKGTAEPGESPFDAAIREVAEETGYEATVVSHLPGAFRGSSNGSANYLTSGRRRPTTSAGQAHRPHFVGIFVVSASIRARGDRIHAKTTKVCHDWPAPLLRLPPHCPRTL